MFAAALMFDGIIGVGIFSVPWLFLKSGVLVVTAYFVVVTSVQLLQHLFLAEAALMSKETIRFRGLAKEYLGPLWGHVAGLVLIFGNYGSQLAYIVVGGQFLASVLSPVFGGTPFQYQLGWGIVGSVLLLLNARIIGKLSQAGAVALLFLFCVSIAVLSRVFHVENLTTPAAVDYLLPYGPVLFALSGFTSVLEMKDAVGDDAKSYRWAVVVGTLAAAILTYAFGFFVFSAGGQETTQDGILGLRAVLGDFGVLLATILGIFAVATSFLTTGINSRGMLEHDYRMPRYASWLLAIFVPLALFLFGSSNFVAIIGFSGAVLGGAAAVIVSLMFFAIMKRHARKAQALRVSVTTVIGQAAVFVFGAVIETARSVVAALK
jgi:amino acid permease